MAGTGFGQIAGCDNETSEHCEIRSSSRSVLAEDRNILGVSDEYPADTSLRGQTEVLRHSQKQRRQVAWQTVVKILSPTSLDASLDNIPTPIALPLWQTWYGSDEAKRLFQYLYEDLSPVERTAQTRFHQTQIDAALGWNATAIEDLANWPEERRAAYWDAIDSQEKLIGIAGVDQISFSPASVRHMLRSYPEVLRCEEEGVPEAFTDSPGESVQQIVREPLSLQACSEGLHFGPYYVSQGESLVASLSGTNLGGAIVRISSDESLSECESETVCESRGSNVYYVEVIPGPGELRGALQVDYRAPDSDWSSCLESPFPASSVIVKANWKRIFAGSPLATYDTSAQALTNRLQGNETQGWTMPDGFADPDAGDIYTMELPNGQRYRLAGLHIMTKELDHWQWITLWWSDVPDRDFGEDRPDEIRELGGPWSHYKMCAVTMFDEGDPDPSGGFTTIAPDLAAALASVYRGVGEPSWCSNPYIEEGPHNMATNCIGCHQHGGSKTLRSENIIGTPMVFPHNGRTQVRNNFPQDYSWALSAGDRLGIAFKIVVDFFAAQDSSNATTNP